MNKAILRKIEGPLFIEYHCIDNDTGHEFLEKVPKEITVYEILLTESDILYLDLFSLND